MNEVEQIKAEALETMTPEQIVKARREGRLNELLGMPTPLRPDEGEQLTTEDLKVLSPEEIVRYRESGHLDALFGRTGTETG